MNLLIIYPKDFKSFVKFSRKISNILSDIAVERVIYISDPNSFIINFFKDSSTMMEEIKISEWGDFDISHAIIFDDGEEFFDEYRILKEKNVSVKRIKIMITRVVNIKKDKYFNGMISSSNYEYIGRGSYWGNPYSMYENGENREEVIRKFKYDFDYEKFINKDKKEVYKLAGKRLGCFCKPEACHGDILADFLNSWDDGK